MMTHVRLRRGAAAGFTAATLLASVAACGGQSGPAALPAASGGTTTTAASASPSSSSQATAAVKQALAAYRAAFADWASVEAISSKADYQNPRLADHLTGAALSYVTGAVYVNTNVKAGVTHGQPVLLHPIADHVIPANDPTQVVVNDCVQTDSWLLYTTDGHLYNKVPGGREKTQALVVESSGTWKVSQLVVEIVGTC